MKVYHSGVTVGNDIGLCGDDMRCPFCFPPELRSGGDSNCGNCLVSIWKRHHSPKSFEVLCNCTCSKGTAHQCAVLERTCGVISACQSTQWPAGPGPAVATVFPLHHEVPWPLCRALAARYPRFWYYKVSVRPSVTSLAMGITDTCPRRTTWPLVLPNPPGAPKCRSTAQRALQ